MEEIGETRVRVHFSKKRDQRPFFLSVPFGFFSDLQASSR
jgi:hypothetical protein